MHRCQNVRSEIALNQISTSSCHAEIFAEQGLSRAGTETYQNLRLNNLKFRVKPRTAGFDFRLPRFLVNTSLAALRCHPLEVLYDIGDVDLRTIDSDFGQHFVEQPPGRSDKWMSGAVFAVARLLSDKHHPRGRRAFSKYSLRAQLREVAGLTGLGRILQCPKCGGRRDKGSRA